jgi:hypothetical protein
MIVIVIVREVRNSVRVDAECYLFLDTTLLHFEIDMILKIVLEDRKRRVSRDAKTLGCFLGFFGSDSFRVVYVNLIK